MLYRDTYPGVDLVYYDKANRVEYDFIVAPGVDPSTIELTFTGVAEIKSGDEGDLVLETTAGDLIVSTPFVYQDFDGERHQVAAAFERRGARGAGFALGPYDRSQPLIIDPGLEMGTFVGGSGFDSVLGVAALGDNIWVVGQTNSPDFPAPGGGDPPPIAGDIDMFVAEYVQVQGKGSAFARVMKNLVFIGGSGRETPTTINIDDEGLIHLVGTTGSADFPVTPDAEQPEYGGGLTDLFFTVLRLDIASALSPESGGGAIFEGPPRTTQPQMQYSTTFGGNGEDGTTAAGQTLELVVRSGGNELPLWCTFNFGVTDSTDFPSTPFGRSELSGPADGFVLTNCLNRPGQTPSVVKAFAGLFGGSGRELGGDVVVVRVGPRTRVGKIDYGDSKDRAAPADAILPQPNPGQNTDAFLEILDPIDLSLDDTFSFEDGFSTYLGADGDEFMARLTAIEQTDPDVDPTFFPVISVASQSETAPIPDIGGVPFEEPNPGGVTPFVAILNSTLTGAIAGKWVGGSGTDLLAEMVYDPASGCLTLFGLAELDFDISDNAFQTDPGEGFEGFIEKNCHTIPALDEPTDPALIFSDGFESGDTTAWTNLLPAPEVARPKFGGQDADRALDATTTASGNDVIVGQTSFIDSTSSAAKGTGSRGFPVTENAPQPTPGGGESDGFIIEVFIPLLRGNAILGAADFGFRGTSGIAPQEIMTIFIARGGPETPIGLTLDDDGKVTTQLGPTRVLFNGVPGPMVATSLNQVSAVVPSSMPAKGPPGEVIVEVEVDGQRSNRVRFTEAEANPALFALNAQGFGQGAILNPNFTVNGPENPSDSFIVVYGTGGGPNDVPCPDGELAPGAEPFPRLTLPQRALVDGAEAQLPYAGSAPGLVCGVNQWNVVPTNNPSGVVSIQVCAGENCSQEGITAAFE